MCAAGLEAIAAWPSGCRGVAAFPKDHENFNDPVIFEEFWRPDIDLWRTAALGFGAVLVFGDELLTN